MGDIALNLEWYNPTTSGGAQFRYCRGSPTTFQLRGACLLLPSVLCTSGVHQKLALTFTAPRDSFTVRALAAIHGTLARRRKDIDHGVTAILATHAVLYSPSGEPVARGHDILPLLQGWELNVFITLKHKWETAHHAGLNLEVLEVQLVRPL